MRQSITYQLLHTLKRGADRLSKEARMRVRRYVESQRDESGAFVNRAGQGDLYYTLFGWMLCYALSISSYSIRRKTYLATFDQDRLDDLHQTVLTLCRMIDGLLSMPKFTPDAVLMLMADDAPLQAFFDTYQQHGSGEGTNAWAAKLVMAAEPDEALVERLLAMQHESGGFLAHEQSAVPDLLSTAVALFALHQQQIAPRFAVEPFVDAHWMDNGSFVATLLDEQGDVEYVFYGLLAIGSL